jgi:hypothetical protein
VKEVVGELLPLAVAVSVSPVQIIAVILLLVGPRPRANATAFVTGFLLGVGVVLGLLTALAATRDLSGGSEGSTVAAAVRIVIGLLLLVAAVRKLRARPAHGEPVEVPAWMDGIESFQPPRAAMAGTLIGAVNPKILAMSLGAAVTIAGASLPAGEQAAAMAVYLLVSVIGVSAPLLVVLLTGDRSEGILEAWKAWLTRNGSVVMAVLFGVFGVVFISQGIQSW